MVHSERSVSKMNVNPKFILHYSYITTDFSNVTVVKNGLFFTRGSELVHKYNFIKGQNSPTEI